MEARKDRLGQLDGLRGVAALTVVAHHYFLCFAPQMQPNKPTSPHWLFDTPLALFSPFRDPPALFKAGDRLRFVTVPA